MSLEVVNTVNVITQTAPLKKLLSAQTQQNPRFMLMLKARQANETQCTDNILRTER